MQLDTPGTLSIDDDFETTIVTDVECWEGEWWPTIQIDIGDARIDVALTIEETRELVSELDKRVQEASQYGGRDEH